MRGGVITAGVRVRAVREELTTRELEILALMARGFSNAGICSELWLSPKTIETHVRSIFNKLGLTRETEEHRRVAAVLAYLAAADDRLPVAA